MTAKALAFPPPRGDWPRAEPEWLGIDSIHLHRAIEGAKARETTAARDMASYLEKILASQPCPDLLGPWRDAAGASGVVICNGYLVAEWGDPEAIEMSFSVSKSYVSLVAGVAFDRGLIRDLRETVGALVDDPAFTGPVHSRITWEHLLYQTSEWGGTLWDRPWWSDPQGKQARDHRLAEPGEVWAYNDVRINLLALALTRLWGRALPEVLVTEVLEPLDASRTFEWHGYRNAWIELDGRTIPVVSGGAHWGAGVWANAYDHARIALLYLRRGLWGSRRLLSEVWIDSTTTPCTLNQDYGKLWWLNRRSVIFPAAPSTGFCARGNLGRQLIWVDPARDLVVVSRWSDNVGALLGAISDAIPS